MRVNSLRPRHSSPSPPSALCQSISDSHAPVQLHPHSTFQSLCAPCAWKQFPLCGFAQRCARSSWLSSLHWSLALLPLWRALTASCLLRALPRRIFTALSLLPNRNARWQPSGGGVHHIWQERSRRSSSASDARWGGGPTPRVPAIGWAGVTAREFKRVYAVELLSQHFLHLSKRRKKLF